MYKLQTTVDYSESVSANFLFLCTEKYFKMKKSDCKEALEIYKRFLTRVTKIGEFLKLAEVGVTCQSSAWLS